MKLISINTNEEEGEIESIERIKHLSEAKRKIQEVLFCYSPIYHVGSDY